MTSKLSYQIKLKSHFFGCIIFLFFSACENRQASQQPVQTDSLEVELFLMDFGGSERIRFLDEPRDIAVDDANNVFVMETGDYNLLKFNSEGKYLAQTGRAGQGPGEFIDLKDIFVDKKGMVYAIDTGNLRITVFNNDLELKNTVNLPDAIFPQPKMYVTDSNKIIINNPRINSSLFDVYDLKGNLVDSLGKAKSYKNPPFEGTNRLATEIMNKAMIQMNERGEIFVLFMMRPELHVFSNEGELLKEIELKGTEVDSLNQVVEERQEAFARENDSPNRYQSTFYFTDFDWMGKDRLLIKIFHAWTYYLIDTDGNVLKKYRKTGPWREGFRAFQFEVVDDEKILGLDWYDDSLLNIAVR